MIVCQYPITNALELITNTLGHNSSFANILITQPSLQSSGRNMMINYWILVV